MLIQASGRKKSLSPEAGAYSSKGFESGTSRPGCGRGAGVINPLIRVNYQLIIP